MRRRARVDVNHSEVATAFRQAGWSVLSLAPMGHGCPDLLVAHPAESDLRLIEVKAHGGRLTAEQLRFHQVFPVTIIRSVDDVEAFIRGDFKYSAEEEFAEVRRTPPGMSASLLLTRR